MEKTKKGLNLRIVGKRVMQLMVGTSNILMRLRPKDFLRVRRWKIILSIGIPVFMGVVVVVGLEITTSPEFCSTCHNMEPYYANWETSSHNEVNCIKCHSDRGLGAYLKTKMNGMVEVAVYLSGKLPTSYQTEVSDASCLRDGCHSQEKLKEETVDFKKGILFSHDEHLNTLRDDFRLRCTSCHSQVVQTEHISVAQATCFTCHFKGVKLGEDTAECTLCHSALAQIPEEEIAFNHQAVLKMEMDCLNCHKEPLEGQGEVHREKCLFCHSESERLERINERAFLHLKHTSEHKIECFQCHSQIKHGEEGWPVSFP